MYINIDGGNHWADQWQNWKLQRDNGRDISDWRRVYWEHSEEKEIIYGKVYDGKTKGGRLKVYWKDIHWQMFWSTDWQTGKGNVYLVAAWLRL